MAVPDYETVMLPILRLLGDQQQCSSRYIEDTLAARLALSPDDLKVIQPSGQGSLFSNRVGWAKTYLKKAGLITAPKRGYSQITKRGLEVLASNPNRIDTEYLQRFPEFVEFKTARVKPNGREEPSQPILALGKETPEEALQSAYQEINDTLAQELLSRVKACSPAFFEKLVVQLLVKMGYGGTEKDAAQAVGKSGDEGIDGIINEDVLGLDVIYIQAKRWESTVGSPEIHKFVGALLGQHARKGVFITTSRFSSDAMSYASRVDTKVVLVDGEQLASRSSC